MLFGTYITAIDASLEEVERHLEMGKQFLSKGQFADALTHYHAAVDLDPDNYQTLYRRATVYLAMGKSKSALPDLDRVLTLKPDFSAARLQRGNVLLKQGNLDMAQVDYESVLQKDPDNAEAKQKLDLIPSTRQSIEAANLHIEQGDLQAAELFLKEALDVCPWDADLRLKRASCYEAMGRLHDAISDIRSTTKLIQDNTEAYYKLSTLYYETGDTEESLTQIRECLKLNPDHKQCFPHYKKLKKLVKVQQDLRKSIADNQWESCITLAADLLKIESKAHGIAQQADSAYCKCYGPSGNIQKAMEWCTEILKHDPTNVAALLDRAEAYILNEQFDDAIHDFQEALNVDGESRPAKEGLNRAQKLLKQSNKKDYYKILGVKRNANKQQITKAYRKLAQKWHPDNFPDPTERKAAEKKFIDIAAAKEVLQDPEKRAKFDAGEDPLDPESQQHGHNPFHGFHGFPFGNGGPFTFKFNFQ